jgi:hypothetical protein
MFILYRILKNTKINYDHFHNPEDIRRRAPNQFKPISRSEAGFPSPDYYPSWYRDRFGLGAYQIREALGGRDGIKKIRTFVIEPEEEEEDYSSIEIPREADEDEEED